jgi:hypothetical protein
MVEHTSKAILAYLLKAHQGLVYDNLANRADKLWTVILDYFNDLECNYTTNEELAEFDEVFEQNNFSGFTIRWTKAKDDECEQIYLLDQGEIYG